MKGKTLYPVRDLAPSGKVSRAAVRAWQRAIDDIIASVLSREVTVSTAMGPYGPIQRAIIPSPKMHRRKEKDIRRTLVGCLPEAIRLFAELEHKKHRNCRCRAYCLLRVNASYAAKVTGEDVHEIGWHSKEMFDWYMEDRN